MGVHCDVSPLGLRFESIQRGVNLAEVSRSLAHNSDTREYSRPPSISSSDASSITTQPFPHPLKPLEFWREFAKMKRMILQRLLPNKEVRQGIGDWCYWRTEAEFWAQRVGACETDRQMIADYHYWRIEAHFWSEQCRDQHFNATRQNIPSADYWRRELSYWKDKISEPGCDEDIRTGILNVDYWQCEHQHYINHYSSELGNSRTDNNNKEIISLHPLSSAECNSEDALSFKDRSSPIIDAGGDLSSSLPASQAFHHSFGFSQSVLTQAISPFRIDHPTPSSQPTYAQNLKGVRRSARIQDKNRLATESQQPLAKSQPKSACSPHKVLKAKPIPRKVDHSGVGKTRVWKMR